MTIKNSLMAAFCAVALLFGVVYADQLPFPGPVPGDGFSVTFGDSGSKGTIKIKSSKSGRKKSGSGRRKGKRKKGGHKTSKRRKKKSSQGFTLTGSSF